MNTRMVFIFFVPKYALIFATHSPCNQSMSNEHIILSDILSEYIKKYLADEQMFISVDLASSKKDQNYFQGDFFGNLFNDQHLTEFTHNIFNNVNNPTFDRRTAFNLILIDDSKLLS